jgi:REP element-mobilizing transposase RayT
MPITFQPLLPDQPVTVHRRRLPHWRQAGATYFVTFRECGSLPSHLVEQLHTLRLALMDKEAAADEYLKADREYFRQMKHYLNAGHGLCRAHDPRVSAVVAATLRYYDGTRYELGEFKVMPNHVHALVRPRDDHELDHIVGAWKSFTANAINQLLETSGEVWQHESYDRLVRNATELARTEHYIQAN